MSRAAKLAELRALRASGKTRMSTYEVEEAKDLYDVVDEEGYKKVVRSRLDRDDFVVGDNGEGYADDGREDWHSERRHGYESDSEEDGSAPLRGKAAKRKREEDAEKRAKNNASISNYFNVATTAKASAKIQPTRTADDDAFMADLLGDFRAAAPVSRSSVSMKPVKSENRRKTRVLSPPLVESTRHNIQRQEKSYVESGLDTPPQENVSYEDDDAGFVAPAGGDDMAVDEEVASSPIVRASERKTKVAIKQESEDEDDVMEVAQGRAYGTSTKSVNISGARPPVMKMKKPDLPTPDSSSPTRPSTVEIDASSWNNVTEKLNVISSSPATEAPALGKLSRQDVVEEDGSLRFFWMDYSEINGSLLLFGKVKSKKTGAFASAFVKVDNILRKLFFLPREYKQKHGRDSDEEVDMGAVYEEVDTLMSRLKVSMHKIKPCSRKYAFELPGIPKDAEYLKLLYPYDKPALSADLKGETFSHVFGANTSLFEQFVLWKRIMGPCWLKIDDADFTSVTNASWCKLELQVTKPQVIAPLGDTDNLEAPPLTLMSIALRTRMNEKDNRQEIVLASARIYENVLLSDTTPPDQLPCKTFTVMRPVEDAFPAGFKMELDKYRGTVKLEKTEQALLSLFMAQIQRLDPDVLVGHRLEDLDLSTLLNRLKERKTPGWHRIGRLRRSEWPKNFGRGGGNFFAERQIVSGRLICDLANDMGRSLMTKCQSWSLTEMCELVLGKNTVRRDIDNETALKTWATSKDGLMNYLRHAEADTFFIAAIALRVQMLPLTKVLTNLAGNSWARTLTGTRAERNEYILLHEFTKNKYICPDKEWGKGKQKDEDEAADGDEQVDAKKKDKFKGGLVFEPEKGLYDRVVLVMDFNSLYPSIIQEYNICFTTVDRSATTEDEDKVPEVPEEQDQGILPRLIATLVSRRREVKKLMKDKTATPDQLATWDIKQLALKLTANSMYGCLGYTRSRFYARPLAMLTTFKGREILRSTKELAETRQLQVIYGDTDSVMINTSIDDVSDALRVGNEFKRAVNERYRLLEIDIDNVFRRLLLHAKKKYAAVNLVEIDGKFVEKLEVKGLDMRRREYCALSKDTSSSLLNLLLSGEDPEMVVNKIHDHLRDLAAKMRQFSVPVQKYTIFTQLSKAPSDYPNAKSMPSVQCALKMQAKGRTVRAKDVMSFIITGENNGSQESAASNAFPPADVIKPDSGLRPDIDYYLHKQILPPVERLCAPITYTNVTRLAECLGLDTSKYRVSSAAAARNDPALETVQPLDSQIPDAERFAACAPLRLRCLSPTCKHAFTFAGLASEQPATRCVTHAGFACPACAAPLPVLAAVAQADHAVRGLLARYYEAWLLCDDPDCGARTRQLSVYGHRCLGPQGLGRGCLGRMSWELGEKAVWNQLVFWERAFDPARAKSAGANGDLDPEERDKVSVLADVNRERLETVRGVFRGFLDKSGRQWVDMGGLFGFVKRVE